MRRRGVLNFDETRFLRIQFGAVGDVEAIENRTLSAKLWPVEGLLDHSFTRPVDGALPERTLHGLQDRR
jgi:hypothetical protein